MNPGASIQSIQDAVCRHFRVTHLDLCSRRQGRAVSRPRHVAMWLARHATAASLPEIGRAFGDRDHTTVMAALRRVDARMAADAAFAGQVWALFRAVNYGESVALRRSMMRAIA
jgi:chromosomal replication initiator protein